MARSSKISLTPAIAAPNRIASYEDARTRVSQLLEVIKSPRTHPFIGDDLLERTDALLSELLSELETRRDAHERLLHDDENLVEVSTFFDGRVGRRPDSDQLAKLEKDASVRIERKIPPGYMDKNKADGRDLGDAIMWMQLLEHATESQQPVIFVTDDSKEDWWVTARGKTISPRPELITEFSDRVGLPFHMYFPSRFIEFAGEYLNTKADQSVIDEVKRVSLARMNRRARERFSSDEESVFHNLGMHIAAHADEIAKYLRAVRRISPERWSNISTASELPPRLRNNLANALGHCPCIADIIDQIDIITAPAFHAYASDFESVMPRHCVPIIWDIRHLPDGAIRVTRELCDHARRHPDVGGAE